MAPVTCTQRAQGWGYWGTCLSDGFGHVARRITVILRVYKDLKRKAVVLSVTKGPDLRSELGTPEHNLGMLQLRTT
jgi:hypothetical protein